MTLTRRGRAVAAVVLGGLVWGTYFGIQTLNAVVLPGAVALAAGWVIMRRTPEPSIERKPVDPGMPGEKRNVAMDVQHEGSLRVEIEDRLTVDLHVADETNSHPVMRGSVTYDLVAERRGSHQLGPATVRITDPLGLVERTFATDETVEVLTYPAIEDIAWWGSETALLPEGAPTRERHEFDQLREYEPTDPLRDIHWKSSAKRPNADLVVKQFVAESEAGAVRIVGEADPRNTDAMARAAGSIAVKLLDAGVAVGLELRDATVPVAGGEPQRRRILAALARTEGGRLEPDTVASAPIVVSATTDTEDVTVRIGPRDSTFEAMRGSGRTGQTALPDGGWSS